MFERSMIASQVRHASAGQRWTAMASVTLQVALAGVVIALPLMHPEGLAFRAAAPLVFVPRVKLPEVKLVKVEPSRANASIAMNAAPQAARFEAPRAIPKNISTEEGSRRLH